MINANPIGRASDENPVSQNEVRLGLPRQSPSRRDCTQSSGEAVPQRSVKRQRGPDAAEEMTFQAGKRPFPEFKTERPEILNGEQKSINSWSN